MAKENLEVRAKWRDTGLVGEPVRINADPDDTDELLRHLETIARAWHNKDLSTTWLDRYELQVKSLDRAWIEFTVAGVGEKPTW
jgi:hypothetical protein